MQARLLESLMNGPHLRMWQALILYPDKSYPNTGMLVSRGIFAFLYAYDLLCADNLIDKDKQKQFKDWLRILLPHIKEGARRWHENDYFGKQYYQNHIVAESGRSYVYRYHSARQ